jgi:hypothetical protein
MNEKAKLIIEQLTCLYLKAEESATRTFNVRNGYSTVFTDPFETLTEVRLDGEVVDSADYVKMQWDRYNADWYNSVVLDTGDAEKLEVTGKWIIPTDLQVLITDLAAVLTNGSHGTVKSKRNEDFSIEFNDNTDVQQFAKDNAAVLSRYSICNIPFIRHGEINECL